MVKKVVKPRRGKPLVLTVRGSDEWRGWLEALAQHSRLDMAKMVDLAMVDFAKKVGFNVEAPQR